jgi:hypothetical protein
MHFEELWEKCEEFHNKKPYNEDLSNIIDEVVIKLNLIKIINIKSEISEEDKHASVEKILGSVLFLLTKISVKENINVYKILLDELNSG